MAAVNETIIETSGQLPQVGSDVSGFLINIGPSAGSVSGFLINIGPSAGSFMLEVALVLALIFLVILSIAAARTCMCDKKK